LAQVVISGSSILRNRAAESGLGSACPTPMSSPFVKGGIAVITGAANGIGRATARRCSKAGLRVVLADVDAAVVDVAATLENASGHVVDVSDAAAVAAFAQKVLAEQGPPTFLMCNAGVARSGGSALGGSMGTFAKVMSINYMGAVQVCDAFLPAMIEAGKPATVVNTGSKQGITKPPGNVAYNASKAALNAFTEGLQHELRSKEGCQVSAHLLVPGWVNTAIMLNSKKADDPAVDPASVFFHEDKPAAGAWMPEQVVEYMEAHLAKGTFYIICPDNETSEHTDNLRMTWAMQDYTLRRPPLSRWHPDHKDPFAAYIAANPEAAKAE